jgi:nitrite reductase/ring-hydroxylating ferredoxin subunit
VCRGFLSGTWTPSGPGELQFTRDGEVLQCPRHGWEFDVRSGFELYQERPARLKKYDVKIEDHEILVTI